MTLKEIQQIYPQIPETKLLFQVMEVFNHTLQKYWYIQTDTVNTCVVVPLDQERSD